MYIPDNAILVATMAIVVTNMTNVLSLPKMISSLSATSVSFTNQPSISLGVLETPLHQKYLLTCEQSNHFCLKLKPYIAFDTVLNLLC